MAKKLLKESTVRKFMKLAKLSPLSERFLSEGYGNDLEEDEDLMEDEPEGEPEGEDLMDEPEGEDLMDEPEGEGLDADTAKEAFMAATEALADALGVEAQLKDEGAGAEMDMELEPVDEPGEDDLVSEALMTLLNKSGIEVVDDETMNEALVKRVAARVARRLLKESL